MKAEDLGGRVHECERLRRQLARGGTEKSDSVKARDEEEMSARGETEERRLQKR